MLQITFKNSQQMIQFNVNKSYNYTFPIIYEQYMNQIIKTYHIPRILMNLSKYSYRRKSKESFDSINSKVESVASMNLSETDRITKKKGRVDDKKKI